MKRRLLIAALVVAAFTGGRLSAKPPNCDDVREAEYVRVVAAISRTMRCSTEEEFDAGRDHECDPSEVEQDAGLVDENGEVKR